MQTFSTIFFLIIKIKSFDEHIFANTIAARKAGEVQNTCP